MIFFLLWLFAGAAMAQPTPATQCVSTAIASGTPNEMVIPPLPCSTTTTLLILTANGANTRAGPSLRIDGTQTSYPIVDDVLNPLAPGQIQKAGARLLMSFDGSRWIVLNTSALPTAIFTCPSITQYGGVGNGTTDNLAAWNAIKANGTGCIYFPQGTYSFSDQITYSLSANDQSITIFGDGPDLAKLKWPAGGGLKISGTANRTAFHVHDLTLVTSSVNIGTAINADWGTQHNNNMASSTLDRVRVSGDTIGSTYWSTAIRLNGISAVNFNSVDVWGQTSSNPTNGVGLDLEAPDSNLSFIYNIVNSNFFGAKYGIKYGTGVQGLAIANTNFVLNCNGIYVAPATGQQSQLSVVNSQFDNTCDNVLIDTGANIAQVQFMNDVFFLVPNTAGINMKAGGYAQFVNNQFGTTTAALIPAKGITVAAGSNGIISDTLCVFLSQCVDLAPTASGWQVRGTSANTAPGQVAVSNRATANFNYVTGLIQQSAPFFPDAMTVTAAYSVGGLIGLTTGQATDQLVPGEIVMLTAPGLANQPALYSIKSIPNSHNVVLDASAFGGSLTSNGVLTVVP